MSPVRFGCLRRFCLSTHSESFGVIRWPECDCVCAGVGLSGGRGRLLTHVHRASACTLNAVGLLPVSGRGDARVAPPCPTTLCVWRNLPYLTLQKISARAGIGWAVSRHCPALLAALWVVVAALQEWCSWEEVPPFRSPPARRETHTRRKPPAEIQLKRVYYLHIREHCSQSRRTQRREIRRQARTLPGSLALQV